MPQKGRRRLTEDDLHERVTAYCARYGVASTPAGLPPFPTGQRETDQHREWLSIYKAHNRLGRRGRGQCERCDGPASDGSVFCELHRVGAAARAGSHGATLEDRKRLHRHQDGRCPICLADVGVWDAVDHNHSNGDVRALLHARCNRLVGLSEAGGPELLERLSRYLWPRGRRG